MTVAYPPGRRDTDETAPPSPGGEMYAGAVTHMAGGDTNEAAKWGQRGLIEDIDGL